MTKIVPTIKSELNLESTHTALEVKGSIPTWIKGSLIRNGPVNISVNGKSPIHWFDGLAMLHAFSFSDGKIDYSNQYLKTDAYRKVFEEGSIEYSGFASDPCRSIFKRFLTLFIPETTELHNTNVNVAKYANEYVALTETPLPISFDKETLETLGVFNYADDLPKDKCFESAHPHHDPMKNETINYLVEYGRNSYYTIYRLKEGSKKREVIARIAVENPAYMHSFAVTEHYVILTEFPFVVRPVDFLIKGKGFIQNFQWKAGRGTFFTVVRRDTGEEVGRYQTSPFFAFHHVNAFEKENALIIDVITYPDASIITDLSDYTHTELANQESKNIKLERFTLSLSTGEIGSEVMSQSPMEFPRFNDVFYRGRPYRYAYAIDPNEPDNRLNPRPIYKIDMDTKALLSWSEEGSYPGEAIFLPSPHSKQEDDGVLMAIVMQPKENRSFLLILNAQTMEELGRAIAPYRIPEGLHMEFFD